MIPASDRRTDITNELNIRLAILEHAHDETVKARMGVDIIIDRLLQQDNQMLLALNAVGGKLDTLISQFLLGFKIVSVCALIVVTAVGALYTYSRDLDQKYAPIVQKAEKAISGNSRSLQEQKAVIEEMGADINVNKGSLQEQQEKVKALNEDLAIVKNKKAVKASR